MNNLPNKFFIENFYEIYLAQFNQSIRHKKTVEMEQYLIELNFPVEIFKEIELIGHYGFQKLAKKWNFIVISHVITAGNSAGEKVFETTLNIQRYPGFYQSWILDDLQLSKDVFLAKKSIDFVADESQKVLCEKLLSRAIYNMFTTKFSLSAISQEVILNPGILISEAIESLMKLLVCTPWRKCYQMIESEQLLLTEVIPFHA